MWMSTLQMPVACWKCGFGRGYVRPYGVRTNNEDVHITYESTFSAYNTGICKVFMYIWGEKIIIACVIGPT